MAFETVLSTEENVAFVKKAKDEGFHIRLVFIATDNPEINIARVAKRVSDGGHDVPTEKIRSRYPRSIKNLVRLIPLVDEGWVYDNSTEDTHPSLQFTIEDGKVGTIHEEGHLWADEVRNQFDD